LVTMVWGCGAGKETRSAGGEKLLLEGVGKLTIRGGKDRLRGLVKFKGVRRGQRGGGA